MVTSYQGILVASTVLLCCNIEAKLVHGQEPPHASNVAIIGAGIGGAFTAYNLRQLLNDSVNIHMDAADTLALKRVPPEGSTEDSFSIWDGSKFVFQSSPWKLITLWRLIHRYWFMYFQFHTPKDMLHKFLRLYDLQKQGQSYETPEAFLQELDLYSLTQTSMRAYITDYLGTSKAASRFGSEFVAAVNKVNYNQANTLNAFAGMVSMLPTVDNSLFKIDGGNAQVPEHLLQHAMVQMCNASVTEIVKLDSGRYKLKAQGTDAQQCTASTSYSAVVIATPLELSNIKFEGIKLPFIPPRKYQSTISTFIRGRLRASYFNQQTAPKGAVMVTERANSPFSSLAPARSFADGTILYKLFSTDSLSKATLEAIFEEHTIVGVFPWLAYPVFQPPEQFAPFRLADKLFYNNAWENGASCMEISAISAMNSALLVQKALNASHATLLTPGKSSNMAEL